MRKFLASVLSAAMLLSCVSLNVSAAVASTVYTIDTSAKTITNVSPLTTVATFKSNISGAAVVDVVNVDGSSMSDSAYATDNVYASIDGELYTIKTKAYAPIRDNGSALADNTAIYNMAANSINNNSLSSGGFEKLQSYAKIGYGSNNTAPSNTSAQTVKATKKTINGETVYVMENDSNSCVYLRSHYSGTSTPTSLRSLTYVGTPVITTMSFTAHSEGTVSLYHNVTSTADGSTKGDADISRLIYSDYCPYIANAVHFMEDKSIKIGGTYTNETTTRRTPIHNTGLTWETGKKYTVSVVQRVGGTGRYFYVAGVYINGTKVFPTSTSASPGSQFAYQESGSYPGTYSMTSKGDTYTYGGGISSIMIGTAPKTAGETMTVDLSDVKVYTASSYNPAADSDITVSSTNASVTVDNDKAEIDRTVAVSENDFTSSAKLKIEGDYLKAVSADGLAAKTYKINESPVPLSSTYTVNSSTKVISGVAPLTTVSTFLSRFDNGAAMRVLNIDGSVMAGSAYATDNVSLEAPNGELYTIKVNYAYAPIRDNGSVLADDTVIYNNAATALNTSAQLLSSGSGFGYIQSFAKIGYNSSDFPANTSSQRVSIKKKSINGETVYEIKNDSNNYAYLRSHYTESTNNSTALRTATYVATPVITTMSFTADSEGTVSLYHNVPGTVSGTYKGDRGIDTLIYGSDNPYVANAVHFMEDGKIMLGGTYAHYSYTSYRSPIHDTGLTWEPGKKYTVSVVQRVAGKDRYEYVEGVYINGTKVFPDSTSDAAETRFAYQSSGTYNGMYSMTTRSSDHKFGGGISSIMVGTAPKTAGETMTVDFSDVKVYTASSYVPAADNDITVSSDAPGVYVDNDSAEITCTGSVSLSDFESSAKLKLEGGYLKAVSADGLVSKTYSIVSHTPASITEWTQVYGSDGEAETEEDGVWAKAFTFRVTPNDDTVSAVKITAKNGSNEILKEETLSSGTLTGASGILFGMFAATNIEGGLDGITFTPSIVD